MDLGLSGRAAIVTGAGRGIGRAIAEVLASEGAAVVLVGRGSDALDDLAASIAAAGGRATVMAADVTDPRAASAVVERCTAELGRLDILVNNAGGSEAKALADLSDADWQHDFDLNFFAAARLALACAPVMSAAGWGRLVHIGSTSGRRPDPLFAPYSAAKAALANLSVTLSGELAPHGVTSNCIVAGITDTDAVRSQAEITGERTGRTADEVMARVLARSNPPAGRLGTPEDIAGAVAFLCSDQASWITGATLAVDGGTLRSL